jgi:hypothetical protein
LKSLLARLFSDDAKVDGRFLGLGIRGFAFLLTLTLTFGLWILIPALLLLVLAIQVIGIAYFQFNYAKRIYGLNRKFAYQLPEAKVAATEKKTTAAFVFTSLLMVSMFAIPVVEISRLELGTWNIVLVLFALIPFFAVKRIVVWLESVRDSYVAEVLNAVNAHGPKFILHFDAPPASAYQVKMWLPYLERVGENFILVMRQKNADFNEIKKATNRPILLIPGLALLDTTMESLKGIKACVYVNNGQKNSQLVRFGTLTHIQLLHGESDKSASFSKVTRMFDRIFVAGQAGIDRYAQNGVVIAPEQFEIVGRPQLEGVKSASVSIKEVSRPTVLYAPTWEGMYTDSNYSSLPVGAEIVEELVKRNVRVIFRPHPYSYKSDLETTHMNKVKSILERANANLPSGVEPHLYGELVETKRSLFECFNESDVLISDVSSVTADYLMSQKPMVIYNYLGDDESFLKNFPVASFAYVVNKDLGNFQETLDNMFMTDSMASARARGKVHVLGDFPAEEAANRFVAAIKKCL